MNRNGFWTLTFLFGAAAVALLGMAWCTMACGAGTPSAAQQAAVASDALDQKACVENAEGGAGKAALQAEIDKCRADVKAKRDGGAP